MKWVFFDLGATLVDENDVYKSRCEFAIRQANIDPSEFMNYPPPTHVGRGFCYAAKRHEPAGIVYPAEQGMSTMPLSH